MALLQPPCEREVEGEGDGRRRAFAAVGKRRDVTGLRRSARASSLNSCALNTELPWVRRGMLSGRTRAAARGGCWRAGRGRAKRPDPCCRAGGCERAGQSCGLVHGHRTQERSGVGGCHRKGCGGRTVDLDLRRGGGVACEEDNWVSGALVGFRLFISSWMNVSHLLIDPTARNDMQINLGWAGSTFGLRLNLVLIQRAYYVYNLS